MEGTSFVCLQPPPPPLVHPMPRSLVYDGGNETLRVAEGDRGVEREKERHRCRQTDKHSDERKMCLSSESE